MGLVEPRKLALCQQLHPRELHMSVIKDLLERPFDQAITSKYTAMNGLIYLGFGALVLVWPGMVQTIFRDAAFVGNEAALVRVTGMTVMVIGWLYLFGGLSGGRRIVAASVLDRVVLVPLVLVPLAIAGVFPHFLLAFAILDPTLGIGAWLLLSRSDRARFHSTASTFAVALGTATPASADVQNVL